MDMWTIYENYDEENLTINDQNNFDSIFEEDYIPYED